MTRREAASRGSPTVWETPPGRGSPAAAPGTDRRPVRNGPPVVAQVAPAQGPASESRPPRAARTRSGVHPPRAVGRHIRPSPLVHRSFGPPPGSPGPASPGPVLLPRLGPAPPSRAMQHPDRSLPEPGTMSVAHCCREERSGPPARPAPKPVQEGPPRFRGQ